MVSTRLIVLVASLLLSSVSPDRVRYDNYKIYQVHPNSIDHLKFLAQLEVSSDSLNYLTPVVAVGKPVNILVAPHKQPEFIDILHDRNVSYHLVSENFQQALDVEQAELRARSRSDEYDWNGYHTLEETYEWLRSLEQRFPQYVKVVSAGKTYEGRDILGVKVSFKDGNKAIFLEGGIHAREWISSATVTFMLNAILTSSGSSVRRMVEKFDWHIFPHANPDGFAYTHSTNRLWRKTRSKSTLCFGADPNRNWDYHWREIGASSDECSETYAGSGPFSEIEMRALSEYLTKEKDNIRTFISYHSYGQLMLFPYSWTDSPAPNHDDHQLIGDVSAEALSRRYGTRYTVGNSYTTIYPTSGSSDDWVYGVLGIKLSYTIELRPKNSINGFVLPSAQIIPTASETFDGLLAMTEKAEELGYYN